MHFKMLSAKWRPFCLWLNVLNKQHSGEGRRSATHRFLCYWQVHLNTTIIQCDIACTLHWHHNDHDGISNHQPHGCSLNRLFRCRWKKTSKLRVTGLWVGNSPGPVNSPHKGPVTRKMFPFDDVIMIFSEDVWGSSQVESVIPTVGNPQW